MSAADPRALVEQLLNAFGRGDVEAIGAALHDDASFELPFEDRFETKQGKDAVAGHFAWCLEPGSGLFRELAFEIEAIHHDDETHTVIVQYRSQGVLREFGAEYSNRYVGVFAIRDRLVARWQEYADPLRGTSRRLAALREAAPR